VSLDFGAIVDGFQGDAAITVGIGKVSLEAERLMKVAEGVSNPSIGLFYISGLALLLQKETFKRLLNPLSYMGRMALTSYLTQSVVLTIVFYNYGFGFLGQKDLWLLVVIGVPFYLIQIIFSKMWLAHFRFGPAEWLWRSLTYKKLQPMKNKRY